MPTRHKLRRLTERCETCGRRGRWNESWHTYGNRDGKVWHGQCMALEHARNAAEERMQMLDLITEVCGISGRDAQTLAGLREDEWTGHGRYEDLAFRVFYALDNRRKARSAVSR